MVTDVMGDIEGYTDYCRQLEDIANAERCEGNKSEFNALSMRIKDVLYKSFLFIEGHKLIEGHWEVAEQSKWNCSRVARKPKASMYTSIFELAIFSKMQENAF